MVGGLVRIGCAGAVGDGVPADEIIADSRERVLAQLDRRSRADTLSRHLASNVVAVWIEGDDVMFRDCTVGTVVDGSGVLETNDSGDSGWVIGAWIVPASPNVEIIIRGALGNRA